jgi:hypothetical protein
MAAVINRSNAEPSLRVPRIVGQRRLLAAALATKAKVHEK